MKFTYISLFSGIGGFEQALNNVGGECLLSSEINPHANQAYEILYGSPTSGDVTAIPNIAIPKSDIVVAGFPCQSFSSAGRRGGLDDARGTLFYEVFRIITHAKPKAFILENVLGILTHDSGKTIQTILNLLSTLPYRIDYKLLNSSNYNLPQNRERFILVGVHKDYAIQEKWFTEEKKPLLVDRTKNRFQEQMEKNDYMFNFPFPEDLPLESTLADYLLPVEEIPSNYFLSREQTQSILSKFNQVTEPIPSTYTIRPQILRKVRTPYAKSIRKEYEAGLISHKRSSLYIHIPRDNDKSNTLTTVIADNMLIGYHNEMPYVRYLHPKECLTLQGFPSTIYDQLSPTIAKSHLYRMAGNAVSVPVIEAVMTSILRVLNPINYSDVSRGTSHSKGEHAIDFKHTY